MKGKMSGGTWFNSRKKLRNDERVAFDSYEMTSQWKRKRFMFNSD